MPTEAELARREGRSYETGAQLLARILAERRAQWSGKGKYREPERPGVAALPELPQGWAWATVGQISADASYGTSVKCGYGWPGLPVLRIPNVVGGRIDLADLKHAPAHHTMPPGEALAPGDLLVIRTNGSKGLIGKDDAADAHAGVRAECAPPCAACERHADRGADALDALPPRGRAQVVLLASRRHACGTRGQPRRRHGRRCVSHAEAPANTTTGWFWFPGGCAHQRFISDHAAFDHRHHDETPGSVIREVCAWLKVQPDALEPPPAALEIFKALPVLPAR